MSFPVYTIPIHFTCSERCQFTGWYSVSARFTDIMTELYNRCVEMNLGIISGTIMLIPGLCRHLKSKKFSRSILALLRYKSFRQERRLELRIEMFLQNLFRKFR